MTSQLSFCENHKPMSCFLRLAVRQSQRAKIIRDLWKNKQIKCLSQRPWNLSVSIETKCKWLFPWVNNIDITLFISSIDMPFSPCSGPTNLSSSAESKLPPRPKQLRTASGPHSWEACISRGLPPSGYLPSIYSNLNISSVLTFWDRNWYNNFTKNQTWDECTTGGCIWQTWTSKWSH